MANPEWDNYNPENRVMAKRIVLYEHHGTIVSVREDLKGKHREYCLCYDCASFKPGLPEENCSIANMIYALCIALDVTTPVWECPKFKIGGHYISTKIKSIEMVDNKYPLDPEITKQLINKEIDPGEGAKLTTLTEHKSNCAIHNNPPRGFSSEVTQCDCGAIIPCSDDKPVEEITTKELVEN